MNINSILQSKYNRMKIFIPGLSLRFFNPKTLKEMKVKFYMIFLTLVISFIRTETTMAQMNDYKKQWDKVEALDAKGLTKSAFTEVKEILKTASADKNHPQMIKAAMYKMSYESTIEEESDEKNLQFIDSLANKMNNPGKAILLSIKAEMLWDYVQDNRYSLYDRTKTNTENKSDFKTWSIETFHQYISTLYKASLENETTLKNTAIKEWDAIIEKGKNTRQNRPTLFDFLAFRAFEYFSNDEINITEPANKFVINNPDLLGPVAAFTTLKINSSDSASNHLQALKLLQKILQFHSNESNKDALIDADLARIKFVSSYGVFKDKEELLEQAYLSAEKNYAPNPGAAQFSYLRSMIYLNKGYEYNPFSKTDVQFEIRKAKMLCDSIIVKYPGSDGAINANNTLLNIKKNAVKIETEKVCIPEKPFKAFFKYKNVSKLYCKIIPIKNSDIPKIINNNNDYSYNWHETILKMPSSRNWSIDLPDLKDFQEHAVEIKIDPLSSGSYFLLTSIDSSFSNDKNLLTKNFIHVSNISYLYNKNNEVYILNRETGFPLKNANVQTWKTKYNSNKSEYEFVKKEKYTSDENGMIQLKKIENYDSHYLEITYGNDVLFTDDYISRYPVYSYERDSLLHSFIFTDRAIYRPGQQVFFKGIVVKELNLQNTSKVVEKFKTTVNLLDANRQKVSSVKLITNEFGSYNGSFKLPEGLLNGRFSIKDSVSGDEQYFNVEEYKRPKFYAEIKKPEGTYRINELINVTGLAKAYAGNAIRDAKVSYRVVRKVQFPVWWGWGGYYRSSYTLSSEEMEITNGETKTNEKGEFTISFNAIPDQSIEKKNQPIFYYEVSADITDLNGETRSASSSIAVAYQAFQISIESPEMVYDDKIKDIKIKTLNYNDIHESTNVRIELKKLEQPTQIFKERYWDMPDLFLMSKSESYKSFPDELYADEDEKNKWPVSKVFADFDDSTKIDGKINLKPTDLKTGWYKMIVSAKDKYGEGVYAEKYIEIKSRKNNTTDKAVEIITDKKTAEPGEQINYNIATQFDKVWIIQSVIRSDKKAIANYTTSGKNAIYSNKLPINESDRGGINLCYVFIKNNRVYTGSESFVIPWSNKELNIQYETFRDKLSPGSKEKWKIKIKGNKADKIASEVLVSMYDASLDQFMMHEWASLQSLWQNLLELIQWEKYTFGSVGSFDYNSIPLQYKNEKEKSYDQLFTMNERNKRFRGKIYYSKIAEPVIVADAAEMDGISYANKISADSSINPSKAPDKKNEVKKSDDKKINIRRNFNETAFFYPALTTDAQGNIEFTFSMPEALTEWKMMTLSHTKELASGYSEKKTITQKELMIQPNAPRLLRGGDKIQLPAKIVNMSDKELSGTVELELFDATTNKVIAKGFDNINASQSFKLSAGQSQSVFFPLMKPEL
ncbi:MAG: hypothetical protein FGM46_04630 [Ferruginibacter sp.]|nr:hypothetical protein [Ferruginibacter sp.]